MLTLSQLSSKIKTFFTKVDNRTKIDFIQAYVYSGFARFYILFVPFNKLRKKMGKSKEESPEEVSKEVYRTAKHVSWVITQVSRYTPWESKCLVQALAAQKLLKNKGISTTIYLGVKKDSNNQMLAHAWIRCGQYFVTGGANKDGYAVVAKFSN